MKIQNYGKDERSLAAKTCLSRRLRAKNAERYGLSAESSLFLLPIPSGKDEKTALAAATAIRHGDVLAGYAIPTEAVKLAEERGARVVDLALDEGFTAENAKLTALGTLGVLLTTEKAAPSDLSVGIIGYGRIGRELLRLLLIFGAKVTVFTSGEDKRLALGRFGVHTVSSLPTPGEKNRFRGVKILINTAPAKCIAEQDIPSLAGVRILELASGDNLPGGLRAERLPSIPARAFPESAGRLYAERVLKVLKKT